MPGPRALTMRPSLKTTARSYSFRIFIPLIIRITTITRKVANGPNPNIAASLVFGLALQKATHLETHAVVTHHLNLLSNVDFPVCLRIPVFAMHEDLARRTQLAAHLADLTDKPFQSQG